MCSYLQVELEFDPLPLDIIGMLICNVIIIILSYSPLYGSPLLGYGWVSFQNVKDLVIAPYV